MNYGSGLTGTLGPVTKTTSPGSGPGTFAGPAVTFTVTFSQTVQAANVATNLAFADGSPGLPDGNPVINGNSLTYLFDIDPTTPADQRGSVTITVQPAPTAPVGQFSSTVS